MTESLRFPTGRFAPPVNPGEDDREEWIRAIYELPDAVEAAVRDLSDDQLDTRYRSGGWTVRQVVHHLADSHMNAYVRFRLAVTEDTPTIKPYAEDRWAELADARSAPLAPSLSILRGIHDRWVRLLQAMEDGDWSKAYHHPESGRNSLVEVLARYAWHGHHHVAQIEALRRREQW